METKTDLTEKIINGLKKAATELEEFRVQVALGKAEAKEKFEYIKKEFLLHLHDIQHKVSHEVDEQSLKVKNAIEHLAIQLALGKAEGKEFFNEQYHKIRNALHELEIMLRNSKIVGPVFEKFLLETEKFRIRLEILQLRLERKSTAHEEMQEEKSLAAKLDELLHGLKDKSSPENRWEHFRDEIHKSIVHLKNAFAG